MHVDPKTKELLNPDMIHPFSLATKFENDDYPTFKEILKMPHDKQQKWFDSLDEELCVLFESGACELVDREEVIKQGKEKPSQLGPFARSNPHASDQGLQKQIVPNYQNCVASA